MSKKGAASEDDRPKAGLVARLSQREVKGDIAARGRQLRAELDELLRAEKDREAALQGKPTATPAYKLYQTLYQYKGEDPDDLSFEAGEILR